MISRILKHFYKSVHSGIFVTKAQQAQTAEMSLEKSLAQQLGCEPSKIPPGIYACFEQETFLLSVPVLILK